MASSKKKALKEWERGWHECESCEETVYCNEKRPCKGLPEGLCDECYLMYYYNHSLKSEQ